MTSTAPSSWVTVFSALTLTLNPTQAGSVTMTKTAPTGIIGTFAVNATAADANHAATGVANCTVTAAPEPINITLTALPSVVPARSTVNIQSVATKEIGGAPISGASVTFKIVRGTSVTTKVVTTNSSGVATWAYKAQQKGTYTVTSTATFGGATDSAGPVTFTAN
jgi:hypothetical protein